ncbi:hypothetical protein BKA65DRAFT_476206 [Rhexocercosporidium sp. MPI-PUGE-AT-0058]|nr:hypothetical protein BKA65DRAFT_476206 [Rhexocercosporidium sp. MPI-PUGE-AT-0058]
MYRGSLTARLWFHTCPASTFSSPPCRHQKQKEGRMDKVDACIDLMPLREVDGYSDMLTVSIFSSARPAEPAQSPHVKACSVKGGPDKGLDPGQVGRTRMQVSDPRPVTGASSSSQRRDGDEDGWTPAHVQDREG